MGIPSVKLKQIERRRIAKEDPFRSVTATLLLAVLAIDSSIHPLPIVMGCRRDAVGRRAIICARKVRASVILISMRHKP
jgi:hypothetical protein